MTPSNPVPLIEIRNVTYQIDGHPILSNVSWRIQPGEHWVILGPNGAGKTSLLDLVRGSFWPNAGGEVLRLGQRLIDLRELRKSIGWVSHRLAAEIPVRECVLDTVVSGRVGQVGLKPTMPGAPTEMDYEDALQQLHNVQCSDLADRQAGSLSQGELQKVLIARALISRPLLVMLDEPCAGLDPGARERFLSDIHQLAATSSIPSLVWVTHHVEEIMPAFRHLLVIRRGKIEYCDLTCEGIDQTMLQRLYGVAIHRLIQRDGRYWPICD